MFKPNFNNDAGFSILEMLIALLVLSIGLLGVATLQIRGQQFNQVGYLRTQATFLAYDLMDRMRVNIDDDNDDDIGPPPDPNNKNYADDGAYQHPSTASYPPTNDSHFTNQGPSNSNDTNDDCDSDNTSNACSVAQLRVYDLDNWFNLVRETLPGGQASIVWTDTDGNTTMEYAITIRWTNILDRGADAEPEEQLWILQL